jgi:hypothetical protein
LPLLVLGALLEACGRTDQGGDEGSETHWLSECASSSECELGECLCGVCTLPCGSVRDCPVPLNVCLAQGPDGAECAESICQLPLPGQEPRGFEQGPGPALQKAGTCAAGRQVDFVVAADARFPLAASHQTRVAADGDDGFLLFGDNLPVLLRLSPGGELVRTLPPPAFELEPTIDRIVALPDGSLLLSGLVGESQLKHAFIGKVDANWNPVWEQQLELESVEQTDLEALADGGAVLTGVRWLDQLGETRGADDDVFVARFSVDGQLMWERRASFEGVHAFSGQRGFRLAALTGATLNVVVPTDEAVFHVTSDLDGNLDPSSLVTPVSEVQRSHFTKYGAAEPVGIEALPGGDVAIFSFHHLVLLDQAGREKLRHDVSLDEFIAAVRFDAARGELVLAGQYLDIANYDLPGPWIRALASDGEISWEERPAPLVLTSDGEVVSAGQSGAPLVNAAIDGQGNMLMTGQMVRGLEWVWVGGETCGG